MKYLLLFLSFLLVTSCEESKEEDLGFRADELPQRWKLVRMTGSFAGSESEGTAMEWQESYVFERGNTFTKTRLRDDQVETASGSFFLIEAGKEVGFKLVFSQDSEIIANCTSDQVEFLYFDNSRTTLRGSWWACDGPGLFYSRTD